jgi:esterase/lipase superfamily enzyme
MVEMVEMVKTHLMRLAGMLLLLQFAACASKVPEGSMDSAPVGATRVAYVSTRALSRDDKGQTFYDDDRGELSWGHCQMSLQDEEGLLDTRAEVVGIQPAEEATVLASLSTAVADSGPRVVLYVHGFNIGFEKGCRRAARLQHNLQIDGRILLFSWPSNGNFLNYLHDIADLEWTSVHLEKVLLTLAATYGGANVDLIGHSLGARGLSTVLANLTAARQQPFGSLILVAPDMDREMFNRDLPRLRQSVTDITLYVSDRDKALALSRRLNGYPRLGEAEEGVTYSGVNLVDVSSTDDEGPSGHRYHLFNPAVVEDMRSVVDAGNSNRAFERVWTDGVLALEAVSD